MYSQNNEEEVILNFFQGRDASRFLDIGAFDGKTLSNVRALYEKGWTGVLVEPSPNAFTGLMRHYPDGKCDLVNAAIGENPGLQKFHSCPDAVSTFDEGHRELWSSQVPFQPIFVNVITIRQLLDVFPGPFPFITVDVEGTNYEVIRQLPLKELECELLCVEFGTQKEEIVALMEAKELGKPLKSWGWKRIAENAENLIYARQ